MAIIIFEVSSGALWDLHQPKKISLPSFLLSSCAYEYHFDFSLFTIFILIQMGIIPHPLHRPPCFLFLAITKNAFFFFLQVFLQGKPYYFSCHSFTLNFINHLSVSALLCSSGIDGNPLCWGFQNWAVSRCLIILWCFMHFNANLLTCWVWDIQKTGKIGVVTTYYVLFMFEMRRNKLSILILQFTHFEIRCAYFIVLQDHAKEKIEAA